mgnify:CR=1 FL=1
MTRFLEMQHYRQPGRRNVWIMHIMKEVLLLFGVLPAILFYIPYKLITGHDLMTWNLMPVLTVLTVLAIYWFVYVFCKKYFEKVSMAVYFLSGLFCDILQVPSCILCTMEPFIPYRLFVVCCLAY